MTKILETNYRLGQFSLQYKNGMSDTLTFDTFDFQISPHKKTIDHESTMTSQHFLDGC